VKKARVSAITTKKKKTTVELPARTGGRPRGKKTNPDYVQVTVYLRKDNHTAARKLLLDNRRQFSDLVDELVSEWISNQE
jgi:hypothetical protein